MLFATALARLKLEAQATIDPKLSDAECQTILDMFALEDTSGLAPSDTGWEGTWDLTSAYRKAWLIKARKASADVDYDVDGARYSASQMHEHCMTQANSYNTIGVLSVTAE